MSRFDFTKRQAHTETGLRVNHRGAGFEEVVAREDFYVYMAASWQGSSGVQITAVHAKFVYTRASRRLCVQACDFRGSGEGETWRTARKFGRLSHSSPCGGLSRI